jgi:colicin import membrane protein
MDAAAERLEFAPPDPPGLGKAMTLALTAHLLLALALTWGITWKHEPQNLSAQAELWSPQVQEAAPPAPPPPPPPAPVVTPAPPPVVAPPPPAPLQRDADIALEQQRKREAAQKERREELEERKRLAEQKKRDDLKKAQARKEREELQAREAAEDRRKADAARAAKAQEEEKRLQAQREANLKRMQAMAGTGAEGSPGTAARSSGPSDSYAGRIRARVRPNIVFTDIVTGNPKAEVEVRLAPDGTITGVKVVKPSGNKAWDEAVTRALDRTEVLPRDVDGRVHSPMVIVFSARD